jgi:hypothetical protein
LEQAVGRFDILAFEDFELRPQSRRNLRAQAMVVVNNRNFGFTRCGRDSVLRRGLTQASYVGTIPRVGPILGAKRLTVNETARLNRHPRPRRARFSTLMGSLTGRQVLFVNFRDDDVIRINHFSQVNGGDFREQLVGVKFGQSVILMNPANELRKCDAQRII